MDPQFVEKLFNKLLTNFLGVLYPQKASQNTPVSKRGILQEPFFRKAFEKLFQTGALRAPREP